jgi:hypothetical protein
MGRNEMRVGWPDRFPPNGGRDNYLDAAEETWIWKDGTKRKSGIKT